jgi:hypothetical protein
MRIDPSFNAKDHSTWAPTLTVGQVAEIYQRTPGAVRKASQLHRFIPAPYKQRPWLWRTADVLRDLRIRDVNNEALSRAS